MHAQRNDKNYEVIMKKYNAVFLMSVILAVISLLVAAYAFSASAYIPAVEDGVDSPAITSSVITVTKILASVLTVAFSTASVLAFSRARNTDGLCARLEEKRSRFAPLYLFVILSALVTACSLIYIAVHRNTVWDHYIFRSGADMFMDFFNHITYVREPSKVYSVSEHACFPPFIYIFYYLLSLLLPETATIKHDASLTAPYAIVMYVMYAAVCCILLYIVIGKLLRAYGEKISLLTTLLIMASSVFITVTERGNSVLIVLLLLLAALHLRNSDKAWKRELALVCIAMAAGIKIYPAVFGLLYISEKRWREAVRLVIWGLVFFFVPFVFFGGIEGLKLFISNQMAIHDDAYMSFTSISSSVRHLAMKLKNDPFAWEGLASKLPWVFTAVALVAFFFGRLKLWEKVMLLVCIVAFVPAWSGSYTAVFFAIPMLLFFRDTYSCMGHGREKIYNIFCTVCFVLAFSLILFVTEEGGTLYEVRYIAMHFVGILILIKALFAHCAKDAVTFISEKKARKA